ncbi:MAG: 4Fe-4S cluster-binding domain-containing protein [Treponema sp.]|nr:4Fe-4S cluster-binding domain-containing protein [Treponema sp.]
MKGPGFFPTELIFAVTDKCNLHCPHCYVTRRNLDINLEDARNFLKSCKNTPIERIGFSGGEPFLNLEFITEIVKEAISQDLMFDRIITNGVWWKNEDDLKNKLTSLYEAGYDGKIGLSYDSFHAQNFEKILTFIKEVYEIWKQNDILDIQSVISEDNEKNIEDLDNFDSLAEELSCSTDVNLKKKTGKGTILLENEELYLPIFRELQSFPAEDPRAWKSRKWFKDDYCQGPGQVLFVHPDGRIAPCCGFANENQALILGNLKDGYEKIMQNAESNRMIKICYEEGLSKEIKKLKKSLPGKTSDICAFCDFFCRQELI